MIELKFDTQVATVNTLGGVIDNYQDDDGPIFYPRQEIEGSYRGGSHVCLPNFGPDEITDQPQHGYGRLEEWQVASQIESEVILEHSKEGGRYTGLNSRLTYQLSTDGLLMRLELHNSGSDNLTVSPGFHPYFALPDHLADDAVVVMNGKSYKVDQVADTEWTKSKQINQLTVGDRRIKLACVELKTFAIWSAHPDKYICVEPTYDGNAHTVHGGNPLVLYPDSQARFSCLVSVN